MAETAADLALDVAFFRRWMTVLRAAVEAGCDELTRLDAAIGDADHGVNMRRGMQSVVTALDADAVDSPAATLRLAGSRLVTGVGGAAGPLYGTAFRSMAVSLEGADRPGLHDVAVALSAGLDGIRRMGAAEPGDKTIVDAWYPAVAVLQDRGSGDLASALQAAERAAREGMESTIPMRARKGRASYLGWRSEGHQDPGATSARLIFASLAAAADSDGTDYFRSD